VAAAHLQLTDRWLCSCTHVRIYARHGALYRDVCVCVCVRARARVAGRSLHGRHTRFARLDDSDVLTQMRRLGCADSDVQTQMCRLGCADSDMQTRMC
jgi:hypothetical protein